MSKPIGRRSKHFRFKMRAVKELPSREFAVEFTSTGMNIRKIGQSNSTHRLRWLSLVGNMLLFGNNFSTEELPDGRDFLIELNLTGHPTRILEVTFGKNGLRIFRNGVSIMWSWRVLLNFALSGGG